MTPQDSKRPMHAREKLDFQLDDRIPRFWNGGDPYKTRFFDAMSLTFPIGERYFISSVRAYRDQINDPKLLNEVKDFILHADRRADLLQHRVPDRQLVHGQPHAEGRWFCLLAAHEDARQGRLVVVQARRRVHARPGDAVEAGDVYAREVLSAR